MDSWKFDDWIHHTDITVWNHYLVLPGVSTAALLTNESNEIYWCTFVVGRDSSVGIATRYVLDGPGIESWWGEIFHKHPDLSWGPPSLLYNGYLFFPEVNAAGAWRWPPTPSSAVVKERVQPYLYSPSGPSWPVVGWNLPFLHIC